MAQKVQSIPNPKFSVAPLTTIAADIVSRRRIKIPVSNPQASYTGRNNPISANGPDFLYVDVADNENFLDMEKAMFVMDLQVDVVRDQTIISTESTTISQDYNQTGLVPSFDGSSQALFCTFSIGSQQGLKIEEIQNYNLLSNAIDQHTKSAQQVETSLMDYSDYCKENRKSYDLNHWLDSSYMLYGHSSITPGKKHRIHFRVHQSSFIENARMIPLFLFRNGLRFQINFESPSRAFTIQHHNPIGKERIIPCLSHARNVEVGVAGSNNQFNWFVGAGRVKADGTTAADTCAPTLVDAGVLDPYDVLGANEDPTKFPDNMDSAPFHVNSTGTGTQTAKSSRNTIYFSGSYTELIDQVMVNKFGKHVGAAITTPAASKLWCCIPIRIMHAGQLVWSGVMAKSLERHLMWMGTGGAATTSGRAHAADGTVTATYSPSDSQICYLNDISTGLYMSSSTATTFSAITAPSASVRFFGLSMFEWNVEACAPYLGDSLVQGVNAVTRTLTFLSTANAEVAIDVEGAFMYQVPTTAGTGAASLYLPDNGQGKSGNIIHPLAYSWIHGPKIGWSYKIERPEMILDLVKPSSDQFMKFQQAYMSPSGIPYKFKRVHYKKSSFTPASGLVQVGLNFAVRSLTGIIAVLQDADFASDVADTSRLSRPVLSSFMRKGLTRAEVIVGGQVYPVYPMYCKPDGTGRLYEEGHIPEVECFFGAKGLIPSFGLISERESRSYAQCGLLGRSLTDWLSAQTTNNHTAGAPVPCLDASSFVLAFSLSKEDQIQFATGIDSSQAGSITLNLYFDNSAWSDPISRNIDCHVWGVCDAVFTLQNDANLVRY